MEFPDLGQQCALAECKQLDFLPVKCDACNGIFCAHHFTYDSHKCTKANDKNVQVPVCPLCSRPVPNKRDQLPDVAVSLHIDRYCVKNEKLAPWKRLEQATSLNKCAFDRCKQKDIIYLECTECRSKFCLKHRHPLDHKCSRQSNRNQSQWQSFSGASSGTAKLKSKAQQCATSIANGAHRAQTLMTRSGQAALNRLRDKDPSSFVQSTNSSQQASAMVESIQGTLSEQDAMAIAMSNSIADQHKTAPPARCNNLARRDDPSSTSSNCSLI